ncbi:anaerobic ribonucleoside-triphosphate reductase activating protein [Adlercreutzia sp. ZJ304]|uniref:anaerobic ribonucleoside-triphosphate reductase activating protein n=1 Tax=Adlercreutzia sp. ZJ304 TaxID=2709791 RepID=UPI0013ED2629|nr:anaerobic ribonucleoside-triphosphate reductase activating protein [Adlercreutzia sp. ZJ304]
MPNTSNTDSTPAPESAPTSVRLFGADPNSIVDGPGLRYAVFVQGCTHACPGCHNPESWDAQGGIETSLDAIMQDIRNNGLVHDVTLSGGEPFEQPQACAELASRIKAEGYGLWVFTGYLYEDLLKRTQDETPEAAAIAKLLNAADVLIDGPFVESLKSLDLKWRGSSNQRIIDMQATRNTGKIVEWSQPSFTPPKPASW